MPSESSWARKKYRIIQRENIAPRDAFFIRALALFCALVTGGLMILCLAKNPIHVYRDMMIGSLGSQTVLRETIRNTIPLLIASLSVSLAFSMRFWNIGSEGQILFGAAAASFFALFQHEKMPPLVLLIVMAIASLLAGGAAGVLPALFKAKWDTNETLFTLMINYIAICFIKYLQNGPWKDPAQRGFPKIAMFSQAARLPKVLGVHVGWMIALLLAALVSLYMNRTRHGYEIKIVGESPKTAKYAGMRVGWIMIRTMLISGALSGLVGFVQVAGADYTLTATTAGGAGFTAIIVAWLSKFNPILMVFVSFGIAVLQKGAGKIQTTMKIPASMAEVLIGVILFFMLGCEFFVSYRVIRRQK